MNIETKGECLITNLESKKYWVWLSLISKLGSIGKQKLLKIYKTPFNIYNLKKEELEKIKGLSDTVISNILNKETKKKLDKHIEYMQKYNIDIINIYDKEYPTNLKEIYDLPITLYIKGNKNILNNKSISIVGCRNCTKYGELTAKYFAYNLAKQNVNIVSGLAKGIDSFAHIGAIASKGKTIAVLGNGLDTIYPKENIYLAKKILEEDGAIISEYPLGAKPEKMNFPARNRIISGLSKSLLVIEAKQKSGTLITVDFALEQGRDVYAVPGNINSINSVGTNDLIKQGAKLVTTYEEIE